MAKLLILLEEPACQHLVTALLHTLWQGAIIGAVLFGVLTKLSAKRANTRYVSTLLALCGVVLSGLLTGSILNYDPAPTSTADESAIASGYTVLEEAEASSYRDSETISAPSSPFTAKQTWQAWFLVAWLMGTLLMLFRMAKTLVGARQLLGECHDLEQPDILSLIESLCSQMHVTRRVRVRVTEHLSVPGVIGCIWPTLLLPVSVTSGMPVDDLKAILTHELAHIKRYDYLVNVFQMVIEALLFFNPAIWWISRQMRIEREACCDAVSIASTGQRLKYAEVLVAWTAHLRQNALAAGVTGFADPENKSTMVDRVKRITVSGHRPRLNISWPMAGITIGVSLVCLAALWQGTNLAVSVAARILTPQERIEKLTEISNNYGYASGGNKKENRIQVSGIIRTWDGNPLPNKIDAQLDVRSGNSSGMTYVGATRIEANPDQAHFQGTVGYGELWVVASAQGYAPTFVGPLESRPGSDFLDMEVILYQGFLGQVRVVNEAGHPIGEASIRGAYTHGFSSWSNSIELSTDANGFGSLDHASDEVMSLAVKASGYEPQSMQSLVLDPKEPLLIVLKKAQPITGTVVSKDTGLPIANAEIRVIMSKQVSKSENRSYHEKTPQSDPDILTDENGFFSLDQVRVGWQHLVHVAAQGYGHVYLQDLPAGEQGLLAELGLPKPIRGTIVGDLSLLETDTSGQPVIAVVNRYSHYRDPSGRSPVKIINDTGSFEINDYWGRTVTLKAGYKEITLIPEEDELDNIVIDLSPSVTRDVVLEFDIPEDMPPIRGQVRIYKVIERTGGNIKSKTVKVDITDNQASFKTSAPGQFQYSLDLDQNRPIGYWFNKSEFIDVATGTEPLTIDVPIYPAGALYGKIFHADATLAKAAHASLLVVKRPAGMNHGHFSLSNILSNRTILGTYNATPLPLGGTYAIMAYEGYAFAITDSFTLDQATPMVEANLQLPKGVTVTGRLLGPDGKPAPNTVSLHVSIKRGETRSGRGGAYTEPDEHGRFVFENVNPGPGGSCAVRVIGQRGFRPIRHEIKDLTKPVIIQLERGQRVTGTVIDQATGWPVPGLEVYAQSAKDAQGGYASNSELLAAEQKTNAQGQFEFTNMGSGFYRLGVRGANMAAPNIPIVVTGGQAQAVTVKVTLLPWSELKPKKPE
ncbi:MAG: hypothetical protein GY809_21925 [Planctomycetes bacterium]|nr:hypothetical protein [Planctomycetota bacterium]